MPDTPEETYAYPPSQPGYDGAQNAGQQRRYAAPGQHGPEYGNKNGYPPQQGHQDNAGRGLFTGLRTRYVNDWKYQIFDCLNPGELCK